MTWKPEIDELNRRKELAYRMGGEENIQRQHSHGKLTVRERINLLYDPGTFKELGTLSGKAIYNEQGELESFTPSNYVIGRGEIDGRLVCVEAGDFTVRGGAADALVGHKPPFINKMALEWRVPLVRLIDATGGSVRTLEEIGRTYIPDNPGWPSAVELMGTVPVVAAVMGSAAGLPAIMAAISHWSIMVKNTSQIFVAGPPVVSRALGVEITKEELGNYETHVYKSGVIDNVAENEEDAFSQIKLFLSYLPQNVWQQPTRADTGDDPERRDEELLSIIPRDRKKAYDVRKLIEHIIDKDSMFELSPFYARSFVTAFARLHGYPAAIMANDPVWIGGAQDAAACEKMMRFVDLADTFHLPMIYLMDQPGFMVGPSAESEGTIRKAARALSAMQQATIPWISVLIKRCYGVSGGGHGNTARLNLRYAWPSGEWGSLPIEGGTMAAYKREIEAAPDPDAKRREIEERLIKLRSPLRTAEAFNIEEIIDPRDTRPLLCEFVEQAQEFTQTQLGPKYRMGMRP